MLTQIVEVPTSSFVKINKSKKHTTKNKENIITSQPMQLQAPAQASSLAVHSAVVTQL